MKKNFELKVQNRPQKNKHESLIVESAEYINDSKIAISFTNSKTKLIDFLFLFHKYVKGENLKYFAPQNFKKFIVLNGNIFWGKNEDVIFPVNLLLKRKSHKKQEEILYII